MVPPGTTPPPPEGPRKYATVIITYVACASFHASREAYVAVKGDFQRRLFFPTRLLGLLDTTFLVAYGVGLLFSGSVGARFGNKKVASLGLAGTAIVLVLYGLLSTGWLVAHPNDANEAWRQGISLYVPLVAANGLVQSLGFPNLVAVTSGWVPFEQRGLVLGLWSTTGAAGDIIGLNVATYVLGSKWLQWQAVFFAVAGYLGLMTVILVVAVEDRAAGGKEGDTVATNKAGEDVPLLGETNKAGDKIQTNGSTEAAPLLATTKDFERKETRHTASVFSGLADAWAVPGVLDWSMSYFFIKTVTYTILFWMPYYLTLTLDSQATADNLTVLFDVSMILGTTGLGLLTDRLGGVRSPLFVASFVVGSTPLLFLPALRQSTFHYAAAFAVAGLFSGGPAHMYGTAVAVDLGEAARANGAPGLVSSISGLIDGIGTLGAAIGQSIVAKVASEGELTRARRANLRNNKANALAVNAGASNAVRTGTYEQVVPTGDVAQDEANGVTDHTFEMPSGMIVNTNDGLPLYTETKGHHAGGTKKGIARLVTEMLAGGDASGARAEATPGVDVDTSASDAARLGLGYGYAGTEKYSYLGSNPTDYAGTESYLGTDQSTSSVEKYPVVSLYSSLGDSEYDGDGHETGSPKPSETVDPLFQQRWSRVFFMLFVFNLLAAATLLRVASWELKKLGWFKGKGVIKVSGKRP